MKFIQVDSIPKRNAYRHSLQAYIDDFVNSDAQFVQIELSENDYKSYRICANCFRVAIKRSMLPIKVYVRKGNVYLGKL